MSDFSNDLLAALGGGLLSVDQRLDKERELAQETQANLHIAERKAEIEERLRRLRPETFNLGSAGIVTNTPSVDDAGNISNNFEDVTPESIAAIRDQRIAIDKIIAQAQLDRANRPLSSSTKDPRSADIDKMFSESAIKNLALAKINEEVIADGGYQVNSLEDAINQLDLSFSPTKYMEKLRLAAGQAKAALRADSSLSAPEAYQAAIDAVNEKFFGPQEPAAGTLVDDKGTALNQRGTMFKETYAMLPDRVESYFTAGFDEKQVQKKIEGLIDRAKSTGGLSDEEAQKLRSRLTELLLNR